MCHVLGFGALILLKAASTVVGEDIVVDGSKKQGKGILWDVDYTEFFKLEEQAADYVVRMVTPMLCMAHVYLVYGSCMTHVYLMQGRMQDFSRGGGGPNFKISGIFDIHHQIYKFLTSIK